MALRKKSALKLVSPIVRDLGRAQRIILQHGNKLRGHEVKAYIGAYREAVATKLIEVIGRIEDNPANISKLPKGLASDVYLLCAYLYYKHDRSPISDAAFDKLGVHLLNVVGWDKPITNDDLRAGTFMGTYPPLIIAIGDNLEMG